MVNQVKHRYRLVEFFGKNNGKENTSHSTKMNDLLQVYLIIAICCIRSTVVKISNPHQYRTITINIKIKRIK